MKRHHTKVVLGLLVFVFLVACSAHAYNFYAQNRVGLRRALKARPDLVGKNKRSVVKRFGYPVYRKTALAPEGKRECWSYQPYKNGPARILVYFLNGEVTEVKYTSRVKDWKNIFGKTNENKKN